MIDLAPGPTPLPPGFDWLRDRCAETGGKFIETNHHVIAYVPGRYKSRLLVGFDNLSSAGELEKREPWGYPIAAKRGWGSLGVMIKRKDWFRCPDLWQALDQLRDEGLFAAYNAVSMYGSSMGGFGAAMFAPLAPGCTVLAMAPQTSLSQQITPFEDRYRHARSFADWSHGPYRDASEGIKAAGKAYILYDPYIPQDKAHAARLDGDNVELLPCAHMSHKLPPMFRRMGILKDVAYAGLDGSLTRRDFYQHLRNRRTAVPYIIGLANNAAVAGHPQLAMRAVDAALHTSPNWKLRQLRRELRGQIRQQPAQVRPAQQSAETPLPVVSSMWLGRPFSYLEQLCLKSFLDRGHRVKLYVYDHVENVPEGVEIADANTVLPTDKFVVNRKTGSPGPQADKFRYHMLAQTDEIWVDTDAYCLRPFPDQPYIMGYHYKTYLNNGVLRLPKDSKTLAHLLEFTENEYPQLPPNYFPAYPEVMEESAARFGTDDPMHVSEMPWEVWGPFALTYFGHKTGESEHAMPHEILYPVNGASVRKMLQMPRRAKFEFSDDCLSIHFFGSKLRRILLERLGGIPPERSLIGRLCAQHGIDVQAAPLI